MEETAGIPSFGYQLAHPQPEDQVCITGISGRYPDSDNVMELQENLFNKVDLVTDDQRRWKFTHQEIPRRTGKVKSLNKFDADFFQIPFKEAHTMDPMGRIILESAYESIIDAGVNPVELKNTNTGVFIGACVVEAEHHWASGNFEMNSYGIASVCRSFLAARIARWLEVTGPCYAVDSACSSSVYALNTAYRAIREGRCDAAIVGGCNLCMHPYMSLQFFRLGVLSTDGKCRCFDNSAKGYARAEAVSTCFLQKAKDSRRIYAKIVYSKINCDGFKEEGITFPKKDTQITLCEDFYAECGVPPKSVEFVETHCTGTTVGDICELNVVDDIFCRESRDPLLIGSIKSNLGHAEGAAGMNSLAKMCIAYQTGYIAPNLHYESPRDGIPGLTEGRLKPVTEKTPWKRGISAISSFGFGGANAHVLVESAGKFKVNKGLPEDDLPRLVCASGRYQAAVAKILDDLESRTVDVELVKLLHTIHNLDIPMHTSRGYVLLGSTPTKSIRLARDIKRTWARPTPTVTLVYSCTGPHWSSVGGQLLKLPIFRESIERCNKILQTRGIDIIKLLTESKGNIQNDSTNILTCVCVQIALTDLMKSIGIKPDHIYGKGFGELCVSYAKSKLSLNETLLSTCNKMINNSEAKFNQYQDTINEDKENSIVIDFSIDGFNSTRRVKYLIYMLGGKSENILEIFLANLGELYNAGVNMQLAKLYPEVQFPVTQETPMLSHLVQWNHSEKWLTPYISGTSKIDSFEMSETVNTTAEENEHVLGHVIDGRNLFPATGYIFQVWEAYSRMMGKIAEDFSVVFEDVRFKRATNVPKDVDLEFTVSIHKSSGRFEIFESGATVVTGIIRAKENEGTEYPKLQTKYNKEKEDVFMTSKDFYKELRLRGYQYSGLFRGVVGCNIDGSRGYLSWVYNWVTYMDCMLQMCIIGRDTRNLYVPTRIEKLSIDLKIHNATKCQSTRDPSKYFYKVEVDDSIQVVRSGGVEIRGMYATAITKRPALGIPVLEKNVFVPNYSEDKKTIEETMRVNMQILLENAPTLKVKAIELYDEENENYDTLPVVDRIVDIVNDIPLMQGEYVIYTKKSIEVPQNVTVENNDFTKASNANVVIGTNLIQRPKILDQAWEAIRENGFLISRERSKPKEVVGADIITVMNVGSEYIVMVRKKGVQKKTEYMNIVTLDETLPWIKDIKEKIKTTKKLVLWNQNEVFNGFLGFINCLRREPGGDIVHGILIMDPKAPPFDPENDFYADQLKNNLTINVYRDGHWGTYRHLLLHDMTTIETSHAYVNTTSIGDLSSLRWLQGPLKENQFFADHHCLVNVYASALNFRDIMTASGRVSMEAVANGRINEDCTQGLEVAGRTANGSRVMGFVTNMGLSNMAKVSLLTMYPVPDEWTMEEAVTVPVAYTTVLYALITIGKMKPGESILIHAGSGGVGQAAINVALHHGCEVFTTVGTAAKRAFIKKLFPKLKDSHIGNSRDTSFEDMINRETKGQGVDLALNSLADEKLFATVRCLGYRGRFLEIGKFDIINNTGINLYCRQNEISFHGISVDCFFVNGSLELRKELSKLLVKNIVLGAVKPLTHCVFDKDDVESAFRYMASGKHIGKVIIHIKDEETQRVVLPKVMPIKAIPRYMCNNDGVYIIVGGLGGFGLELADWLIMRGARKLILSSRRGITNGYQASRIRAWNGYGAETKISTHDVTSFNGCQEMMKMAKDFGPVHAVFNLAAVLKDSIFENQTAETFKTSLAPKAMTTLHLDKVTKTMCPELKVFVVFSSVSCGRGNAGQTNYGMSNSVMERICEYRRNMGYPGLAIQWGVVGDVGLVADMQDQDIQLEIGGTLQQKISSCLQVLDKLMNQESPIVSSMVVAEKSSSFKSGNLVDAVAHIIGLKDMKTVSHQLSLADFGMDSLMGVEIKQMLERDFEIILTPQEIRTLTFGRLVELSKLNDKSPEANHEEKSDSIPLANNLPTLINHMGEDLETASLPYVYMPTSVSDGKNQPKLDNLETLFIVPGLDNSSLVLGPMCLRLKTKACILQYGNENFNETEDQMIDRLYKVMKTLLPKSSPYKILGYSFGSLLALRIAGKLERTGHKGTVICLDGSPNFLTSYLKAKATESHNNMDDTLLSMVIDSVVTKAEDATSLKPALSEVKTLEDKLEAMVKYGAKHTVFNEKVLRVLVRGYFGRMKIIANHDESKIEPIGSPIILIRTLLTSHEGMTDANNYSLDKFTTKEVTVHAINANHTSIIEKIETADIINDVLKN